MVSARKTLVLLMLLLLVVPQPMLVLRRWLTLVAVPAVAQAE